MAAPLGRGLVRATTRAAGPLGASLARRTFSTAAARVLALRRLRLEQAANPLREALWREHRVRAAADPRPARAELRAAARDPAYLARASAAMAANRPADAAVTVYTRDRAPLAAAHDYAVHVQPRRLQPDALAWMRSRINVLPLVLAQSMFPESGARDPATVAERVVAAATVRTYRDWDAGIRGTAAQAVRWQTEHAAMVDVARPIADGTGVQLGRNLITTNGSTVEEVEPGVFMVSAAQETVDDAHNFQGGLLWLFRLDTRAATIEAGFLGSGAAVVPFMNAANVEVAGPLMSTALDLMVTAVSDPELRQRMVTEAGSERFYADTVAKASPEVQQTARRLRCLDAFSYVIQVLGRSLPPIQPGDGDAAAQDRTVDQMLPGWNDMVDLTSHDDNDAFARDGRVARELPVIEVIDDDDEDGGGDGGDGGDGDGGGIDPTIGGDGTGTDIPSPGEGGDPSGPVDPVDPDGGGGGGGEDPDHDDPHEEGHLMPTDPDLAKRLNAALDAAEARTPGSKQELMSLFHAAHAEATAVLDGRADHATLSSAAGAWAILSSGVQGLEHHPAIAAAAVAGELPCHVSPDGSLWGVGTYLQLDPGWTEALVHYLENRDRKATFSTAARVIDIPDATELAIIGDWGTGYWRPGTGAEGVARATLAGDPDYTIHLGDTYYAGSSDEEPNKLVKLWPRGRRGSLALNSNHEMYDGARAYFAALADPGGPFALQGGCSYGALRNQRWLIVALDTAYASTGQLYLSGAIDPAQIDFLRRLAAGAGDRRIVILSHHEGLDLKGAAVNTLWHQVCDALGRPPAYWYWGHAHNGVVYAPYQGCAPRCVGHGAVPYGTAAMLANLPTVRFSETAAAGDHDVPRRVKNGFMRVALNGPSLVERMIAEDGSVRWSSEVAGG